MANIFDFIPAGGAVADSNAPQRPANIFDSIPATSNVFDGIPINSGNAQLAGDQFLANILHPPVINPALGVHQPGMFSGGFSVQPSSLQNADDWGFTATILPKVLNNAITRTIGTGLNAAGQALKGDAEAALFQITGQPQAANQELISTAAKMMPSEAAKDQQLGIDTSDPYEDARQTLPVAERIASGIGPGLIQTAPQIALTAVQPELGAASFGFTPDGFDPVQAAAMMIAPAGGKMIGGIAENLAAKAGITSKQALGLINRLGGGTGVASLISAPTAYQIAQMKPGPERDNAIQDAASSAIIAGVLGGMGEHTVSEEPVLTTDDVAQHAVPGPNGEEDLPVQTGHAKQQPQKPVSEKLDDLAGAVKDLQDMLRGKLPQQTASGLPDQADQIIRNVFPAEEQPVAAPFQSFLYDTEITDVAGRARPGQPQPPPEPEQSSLSANQVLPIKLPFSAQAEQFAQKLDSLKTGIGNGGGQLHAFGLAPDLWDRAVTVAQHFIRGGGTVADAIDRAIGYIRENFKDAFDEDGARDALARSLVLPDNARSESERRFQRRGNRRQSQPVRCVNGASMT